MFCARSTGEAIDTVNRGSGAIHAIALLGNYVPRQCGITTFATDSSDALVGAFPNLGCLVVAMNDVGRRHDYAPLATDEYLRACEGVSGVWAMRRGLDSLRMPDGEGNAT